MDSSLPQLVARAPGSPVAYVVASFTCAHPLCLRLYRTTVSATHFSLVSLPPVRSSPGSPTGTLASLVFANTNVGYAVVGTGSSTTLYATFDGARSWHRRIVTIPGVIESVAATTTKLYVEVANCAVTVPYCQNFRLATSALSADRWTSARIPVSRTSAEGSFFGPITARGSDVWVTETGSRAFVVHSRDAGRTFTLVASPQLLSVTGCALTATSATTLWAQCSTGMLDGYWFSGDAARSWTYVATPKPVAGTAGGLFDPVSADLAYLARGGTTNPLERITNHAHTVATVGRLSCPTIIALTFVDASHGLAACEDYTYSFLEVTRDGGATWHHVAIAP